jgi:hypothetical protein
MLNIAPEDEKPIQNYIRQAVSKNVLSQEMVSDFELCVLKMVYNLNASQHTIDDLSLSAELFITCLNSYLTQVEIIKQFLIEFGKVEMLESYGEQYFKIRVPKGEKSIGFVFGLIERVKETGIAGIQEYSVGQTTLEMIFNYFA